MGKYLICGKFVGEGVKGLLQEGGSARVSVVEKLFESLGGKLECFYYAFGEYDTILIGEVPDNVSMASFSLTVSASGRIAPKTTVLITPEEMDAVVKKSPPYRGPGQ